MTVKEYLAEIVRAGGPAAFVRELCGAALANAHRQGYVFDDCPCRACVDARWAARPPEEKN